MLSLSPSNSNSLCPAQLRREGERRKGGSEVSCDGRFLSAAPAVQVDTNMSEAASCPPVPLPSQPGPASLNDREMLLTKFTFLTDTVRHKSSQ